MLILLRMRSPLWKGNKLMVVPYDLTSQRQEGLLQEVEVEVLEVVVEVAVEGVEAVAEAVSEVVAEVVAEVGFLRYIRI